ncbi:hypothetical protein KY284_036780 [Solanum tuberosum]|nr:hypothetical protein KY284_036780 [Solanum tuberosum]
MGNVGMIGMETKDWVELFFDVKVIDMNNQTSGEEQNNETYYGTYNALQTYDHYASTELFY